MAGPTDRGGASRVFRSQSVTAREESPRSTRQAMEVDRDAALRNRGPARPGTTANARTRPSGFSPNTPVVRAVRILCDVHVFPLGSAQVAKEPDPHRRHVVQRPDGQWADEAENAKRAGSLHRTQADAERSAKRVARNTLGGAEVIVHGRIRDPDTINRRDTRTRRGTRSSSALRAVDDRRGS
jgi:hypothetical protein